MSAPGFLLDAGYPAEEEAGSALKEHRCHGGGDTSRRVAGPVEGKVERGKVPNSRRCLLLGSPVQVLTLDLGFGTGRKS